jgi:SAM-dependent methyltransferase
MGTPGDDEVGRAPARDEAGWAAAQDRPAGERTDAGHAVYTPAFLRVYDPLVLRFYSNVIWRSPLRRLVDLYSANLGPRHLDIGPGTGFFLAAAERPEPFALTLLDPNPHVLDHAGDRLADLAPETVLADALAPLPVAGPFDSVALSYVLHCLPGPLRAKAPAVTNVAAVLAEDGVLFGATVLGEPARHHAVGRAALRSLNRKGIFDNRDDTEAGLGDLLEAAFSDVHVEVVGAAALFTARPPLRGA